MTFLSQEENCMRYDEYDEYNGRYSSRGGARREPAYDRDSYPSRGGRSRDYDRGRRDYDRDRRDYDRGYDRGYDYGGYDRYGSRDRVPGPDLEDWERTAPNWEDHGSSRGRSSGRSGGPGRGSGGGNSRPPQRRSEPGRSSGGGGSRNSSRPSRSSQSGGQSSRRSSASQRRSKESGGRSRSSKPPKQRKAFSPVPIVVGVAVIIMALLVINSITGKKDDCVIEFSAEEIVVGETATASVMNLPEGVDESTIRWTSNDNNIVTVTGAGATATLQAKREGQVTIGAQLGDEEAISGTVKVVRTATGVLGITVEQEEMTIQSGESQKIQWKVQMKDEDMTPAFVTWSSQNSSVATVSEDGTVTARNVGQTNIKGTAGEKSVEVVINVVKNPDTPEHDPTSDTGNEPIEGTEPPPDDGDTGTGTGSTTGTGTGNGTGTSSGTGTSNSGSTGSGGSSGTTGGNNNMLPDTDGADNDVSGGE